MIPYYMLFVISMPYAVDRFGASPSMAGLVAGTMILGGLLGRFVSGRLIGIVGSRKVLFFGIAEFILTMALYLPADSLPLLLAVRLLSGVGVGCIGAVTGTLIAHIVPIEKHGVGISYFSLSTILGMAAGPFLGVFLLQRVSFSFMFLLCCGVAAVCLVFALLLTASIPAGGATGGRSFRLDEYLDYRALPVSIVMLLVAQAYGSVQAFMAAYAEKINLVSAAEVFFLVYALTVFLSRPYTGKVLDRRGEHVVIYPSLLLLAGGLLLLGCARSSWTFLLSAALIGAGFGNFQSTCQIISVKVVPKARFAQATSTFFICLDLGIGFGPYLFGTIVPIADYHGLFFSLAAVTFTALPLYYFLHGRKPASPARPGK